MYTMKQSQMNFLSQTSRHYMYVLQVFSVCFTSGHVWTELQIFSIPQTSLRSSGNNELHHWNHAKPDIYSLVSVLSHKVLQQLHMNTEQKTCLNATLKRFSWRGAVSFNYASKSFLEQWKMLLEMNNRLENSYFDLCGGKLRIYTSC